ncbi:MAG: hypothetical protein ACRD1T_00455 [Acidimicrobiia bacterium]
MKRRVGQRLGGSVDDVRISYDSDARLRLLGDHPAAAMSLLRREDDPEPTPIPEPSDEPPPPPLYPTIAPPDWGFQFLDAGLRIQRAPLPPRATNPCLPDAYRTVLHNTLQTGFRDMFVQLSQQNPPLLLGNLIPEVRGECLDRIEHVGVWHHYTEIDQVADARDEGMRRLALLHADETFGSFLNSQIIRYLTHFIAWVPLPKRINASGHPDPNGSIHLTGMTIEFISPNQVVTRVSGFVQDVYPDLPFEYVITERVFVSGGIPQCETVDELHVDYDWRHRLQLALVYVFYPFIQFISFIGIKSPFPGSRRA